MHKYFLSVDIGTSSLKIALFDMHATLMHSTSLQFSKTVPAYKEWLSCFASCVEVIKEQSSKVASQERIFSSNHNAELYITISGQGPSCVYLNESDEVICYSSWQSNKRLPLEGSASYFLPYIRYVQKHMPTLFSDVRRILSPAEYLIYTLCGEAVVCVPHRDYVPYMFSDTDIARCELPRALFPRPVMSGSLIGEVSTPFARKLFSNYTRVHVVAGGLDYLSALIGAGISNESNVVLQRGGTSVVLNAIAHAHAVHELAPSHDAQRFVAPHFFAEKVNIGYAMPAYNTLYMLLQEHVQNMRWTIADMIKFCAQADPVFVTKHLMPCAHAQNPRDAIRGIFQEHEVTNVYRRTGAILLAILLEVQSAYEKATTDAAMSAENTTLAVSGWHANDAMLMKLYAHMLGKTTRTFSPVACELRGNLALARFAAGEHRSMQEAIQYVRMHVPLRNYRPMDL